MVSYFTTYILKSFIYLLSAYSTTVSDFNCLPKVAKPYSVSGPAYLPEIPHKLHYTQNSAHQVLITTYMTRLLSGFLLKSYALFIKE